MSLWESIFLCILVGVCPPLGVAFFVLMLILHK